MSENNTKEGVELFKDWIVWVLITTPAVLATAIGNFIIGILFAIISYEIYDWKINQNNNNE